MKNIIYSFACFLLFAGGCADSKDNTNSLNNPKIALGSWVVSFPQAGGTDNVAVIVNRADMAIENPARWLAVTVADGNVKIVADRNPNEQMRTSVVKFSIRDGGKIAADSITIFQSGPQAISLSKGGTSNCYIAKTETDYQFKADIKGNGSTDGKSLYISKYNLNIENAAYADLLWEATFDADKNTSRDIISGKAVYLNNEIYFSTGATQGNAVIALKDAYGTILWSWHIWVMDAPVSESQGKGFVWMDRNLGALNNTPGAVSNRGLLYQWGRKDPFLPSRVAYVVTEFVNIATANVFNFEVGDGSAQWNYSQPIRKTVAAPGNMDFAVKRPTSFLSTQVSEDWYVVGAIKSALWGDNDVEKTIFDPCPVGYKIPSDKAWQTSNIKTDWGEFTGNGRYWRAGSNDFFPMSGFLQAKGNSMNYTGALGMYWTRSEETASPQFCTRLYLASNTLLYSSMGKGNACLVRCVKE